MSVRRAASTIQSIGTRAFRTPDRSERWTNSERNQWDDVEFDWRDLEVIGRRGLGRSGNERSAIQLFEERLVVIHDLNRVGRGRAFGQAKSVVLHLVEETKQFAVGIVRVVEIVDVDRP